MNCFDGFEEEITIFGERYVPRKNSKKYEIHIRTDFTFRVIVYEEFEVYVPNEKRKRENNEDASEKKTKPHGVIIDPCSFPEAGSNFRFN